LNSYILAASGTALFLYLLSFKYGKSLYVAILLHAAANILMWVELSHPPFIGGYGSMLFFSLIIAVKALFPIPAKLKKFLIGASSAILAGSFAMPYKFKAIEAVLTSFWLGIHVPLFFLGYLSLTTAFFSSFLESGKRLEEKEMRWALFFIFTGIVTGAMWAEVSWGRFWGWDSKEVWALSTWLFTASYFHFEVRKERKMALYAAFVSMLLTYYVISFIVPGMHSYI